MKRISFAVMGAALAVAMNVQASEGHAHWGYEGEGAPEHWAELSGDFATCKSGTMQSPVDLDGSIRAELVPLEMKYRAVPLKVLNNGHTIQVDQKDAGSMTFRGQEYQLVQFHFHTPSEHTVSGQPRQMEAHFVHKDAQGRLAVVGVMINPGKENAALKAVWDHMPKESGEATADLPINAADILPAERGYRHYIGSLTTPPCSEGVRWIVLNEPIEMSQAQIDAFKGIFDRNARPVQPMHDRFLLGGGK